MSTDMGPNWGIWATEPDNREERDFISRISHLIDGSTLTQREIAKAMGYRNANIISMIKSGATRMPIDKLPAFAFAVKGDENELVRLWMAAYMPGMQTILRRAYGVELSDAERSWVLGLRATFGPELPLFDEDAEKLLSVLAKRGQPPPSAQRRQSP